MGNYSRNTYDSAKRYTSVRLQQGVPLVDADWNEQADILRNQTSDSLAYALGTGVVPGSGLTLAGTGPNDFILQQAGAGNALINGRLVTFGPTQYSAQPWTSAATAATAGVPVIPPLTTPTANRNDCVYLDVWEREVSSIEDPNLVNKVIGIETAVRTRWDVAVRVNEGSLDAPSAPAGHTHMRVAVLARTANSSTIGALDPLDLTSAVLDARPVLPVGDRAGLVAVPPVFTAVRGLSPWTFSPAGGQFKLSASRTSTTDPTVGFLVISLPDGARLSSFAVRGYTTQFTTFELVRVNYNSLSSAQSIFDQSANASTPGVKSGYSLTWQLPDKAVQFRVDNRNYLYALFAMATMTGVEEIHGISVNYIL
jgi:hypothetical protein